MRRQGCNSDGEEISSMYVDHSPVDYYDETPSLTRQEFLEDCDVNLLMARYERTGVISHINPREPMYLDMENVPDLHAAMNLMRDAERAFMSLPASIRAEFDNDALRFVDFAEDKDNLDKLREWGLAKPAEPPPSPMKVEVVPGPAKSEGAQAPSGTSP